MCFSFTACGSKSTESNANTESSSFAETDFSADSQETSLSADSSADSSENGETVGQTLLKAFQEEMKQTNPAPTAAELAQTLISNPIIEFFGESGTIEEGLLTGFGNTEITGFQEGAIFAPSISTIPFIGYIFVLDENADVDAFTSTLKENAVKIAIQIAQGLKCLHEHQPMIIYRDLKPENIMITLEGKVKLIDFDISRKYQTGKLRDTELLGTVGYAAPEQFGYFQTDNRTDIFAFGLVFNCMLTGDFSAHNLAKGKYEKLIQKCIALNPADRYQRMDEILKELLPEQQNTVTEIYFEKKEYSGQEVYFGWKANSGQEVNSGRKAYFGQRVYFEQENSSHDERGIRSWILPGFRTRTRWKMIVAGVSYLMIFLIGWMLDATSEVPDAYKTIDLWLNRILLVISQFITIMLVFNYRGISKKIPFYRSKYRIIKIVSFLVTWFVITFATLIFTAILEGILFL